MRFSVFIVVFIFLFSCGGGVIRNKNRPAGTNADTVSKSDTITTKPLDSLFSDAASGKKPEINIQEKLVSPNGVEVEFIARNPSGKSVEKGSVVKINYQGYLPDGKLFDSNEPLGFPLPFYVGIGLSVKGWDDALPLMKTGEKARLRIPAKLAYGKKGYGKLIPPGTDLTFDIEITERMSPLVTQSGLHFYKTLEKGGEKPGENSMVTVHYYGWLENGKLFDSSHMNGKAYTFALGTGRAIEGWKEALKMMSPGEKAFIVVPPGLGYGEAGIPELVPSNSTLVYSLELLEVK